MFACESAQTTSRKMLPLMCRVLISGLELQNLGDYKKSTKKVPTLKKMIRSQKSETFRLKIEFLKKKPSSKAIQTFFYDSKTDRTYSFHSVFNRFC